MATITGLTAARMLAIEAASVIAGIITGDNLILTKRDGTTINAGNVRGPQGVQGVPGSISTSPAGGSLSGYYPDPGLADNAVSTNKVAVANRDGLSTVASMRTLGTAAQQAAAGNHTHADTGWVDFAAKVGDPPFGAAVITVQRAQYRKVGRLVHVRIAKTTSIAMDRSSYSGGNFPNVTVMGDFSIPNVACPDVTVLGAARLADSPTTLALLPTGAVNWSGGFPRNYPDNSQLTADFILLTSN